MALELRSLRCRETEWCPEHAKVALNICMDACVVPSEQQGSRLSFGHFVVLDDLIPDAVREELLELITEKGHLNEASPPPSKWERETCDQAGLPPSWGLKDEYLRELATCENAAMMEVHARLSKLYPEVDIAHMPSDAIQRSNTPNESDIETRKSDMGVSEMAQGETGDGIDRGNVDCNAFVGNAAVYGDCFQWHVDADPWGFPPSAWVERFGTYFNGERGKPLFVSMILYLDKEWPKELDAETLFLDIPTDTGVFVRPKPGRAVLMDQDVLHRVSTPSQIAKRPRYSLVWKLVFIPKDNEQGCCIARPEWGNPTFFGSAKKARELQDVLFKKRTRTSESE